jgi:hypothetical protein
MKKYGAQVQFITVAVSINQTLDRVKGWQKANALPGVMLYDRKGEVSGAYDAPATSYVVVLDKAGKVVYTGVGGKQDGCRGKKALVSSPRAPAPPVLRNQSVDRFAMCASSPCVHHGDAARGAGRLL